MKKYPSIDSLSSQAFAEKLESRKFGIYQTFRFLTVAARTDRFFYWSQDDYVLTNEVMLPFQTMNEIVETKGLLTLQLPEIRGFLCKRRN